MYVESTLQSTTHTHTQNCQLVISRFELEREMRSCCRAGLNFHFLNFSFINLDFEFRKKSNSPPNEQ